MKDNQEVSNDVISKLRIENDKHLRRNMKLINSQEFDIFDKLVIIEGWFEKLTPLQQVNLIDILQGDKMMLNDERLYLRSILKRAKDKKYILGRFGRYYG